MELVVEVEFFGEKKGAANLSHPPDFIW